MNNVRKLRDLLVEFTWIPTEVGSDELNDARLMLLGLQSEIGEVAGCAIKDPIAYGKYDEEHILQEIGDVVAYILLLDEKYMIAISEYLYVRPNTFEFSDLMRQGLIRIEDALKYALDISSYVVDTTLEHTKKSDRFKFYSDVNQLLIAISELLPKGKTLSDACEATYQKQLAKIKDGKFPAISTKLEIGNPDEIDYITVSGGYLMLEELSCNNTTELNGVKVEIIKDIYDPIVKINYKNKL